jgi:hypothetical protein
MTQRVKQNVLQKQTPIPGQNICKPSKKSDEDLTPTKPKGKGRPKKKGCGKAGEKSTKKKPPPKNVPPLALSPKNENTLDLEDKGGGKAGEKSPTIEEPSLDPDEKDDGEKGDQKPITKGEQLFEQPSDLVRKSNQPLQKQ